MSGLPVLAPPAALARGPAGRTGWSPTRPAGGCPTVVNGEPQVAYQGVGGHAPDGPSTARPIRSVRDYPPDGDKRVPDLRRRWSGPACGTA
jgi:hypothetical protein